MHTNKTQGVTLMELIIALAVICIIAIYLLPVFTSGIAVMSDAGRMGSELLELQAQAEDKIEAGAAGASDSLTITFPGKESEPGEETVYISVRGEDISSGSLEYFIPE